jgi:EpsI family protein
MRQSFRVLLSGLLLVGTLLLLQLRSSREAVPIRKPLDSFPTALDGWQGRAATIFDVDPLNVLKPKEYLFRRYVDAAGRSLWVYIAYWDTERKGAQPYSLKNCLPGSGWEPVEASLVSIALPPPQTPITVNRYLIQKDDAQQVVFCWYHSQGRAIAGELAAKIGLVKNAILHSRTDGALIRISSPVHRSTRDSSEMLVRYVQVMYPILEGYLPD